MLTPMTKGNFTLSDSEIEFLVSGNNALNPEPSRVPVKPSKVRTPLLHKQGIKTFKKMKEMEIKQFGRPIGAAGILRKSDPVGLSCSCGAKMEINFLFAGINRRKKIATCPECQISILPD